MSLFGIIPKKAWVTAPPAGGPDECVESEAPRKKGRPKKGEERPRIDTPQYFGIVDATDAEIAKNNRLALMMELHRKRQATQQQKQEDEMGKCAVCGGTANKKNYGKLMCSTCSMVYSSVKNRLPVVVNAIKDTDKTAELLAALGVGEAAQVEVESVLLEKIADMLGYPKDQELISGEQLLTDLESTLLDRQDLREDRERHGQFLEQLRGILGRGTGGQSALLDAVLELQSRPVVDPADKEELISAQTALAEICRAVGLEETGDLRFKDIVLAVAQTSAELEGRIRTADQIVAGDLADLRSQKNDLQGALDIIAEMVNTSSRAPLDIVQAVGEMANGFNRYKAKGERLAAENSTLAEQLSEAEQKLLDDQTRAKQVNGSCRQIDSHLLDLMLDCPDVPRARIEAIRGAIA